jgi:hypothetical protein
MNHPLHQAVADAIASRLDPRFELIRDPACGGAQHLSLFVGRRKASDTRMCCVDLLILRSGQVRAIVEIEESGFLPTKTCGKFLQAALADHFIHDNRAEGPIPYGESVLFLQVLDGAACLKVGSRKDAQADVIENVIRGMLPVRGLTDYRLRFVNGPGDEGGLRAVGSLAESALAR